MASPAQRQERLICPLHVSQKGKSRAKITSIVINTRGYGLPQWFP
jgi:hypothetical protein